MFSYLWSSRLQERGQGLPGNSPSRFWELVAQKPPCLRGLGLVSPKSDGEKMTFPDWEGGSGQVGPSKGNAPVP